MTTPIEKPRHIISSKRLIGLENQEHVDAMFREIIQTHNNPHDDFNLLLPEESPDPASVSSIQAIETIAAIGKSATAKELIDFGEVIIPKIEDYIEIMLERKDLINHMKDRLDQGNIVIATNHRDVIGVALALGMTSVCLQENGVRADEFETDLAVSAMLKYVTTNNFPAVQSMQGLFSRIRFVIPAGNSTVRGNLNPDYVSDFNEDSNGLLAETSSLPSLRGVAPSGTRDIHAPWRFPSPGKKARQWEMKRPSPNTIKFYFSDPVLNISLDLSERPQSGTYISQLHVPIEDMDLATRSELIMSDLASAIGKPALKSVLVG